MKRGQITSIVLLFLFSASLLLPSCSDSTSKHSDKTEPTSTEIAASDPDVREGEVSESLTKNVQISFDNLNHVMFIAQACGHYENAYGSLPASLEDMLDGFMPGWPGCVYTKEPYKIISTFPDPLKPEDIGKVFYEVINECEAKIWFLDVDLEASKGDELVWLVDDIEIEYVVGCGATKVWATITPEQRQFYGYLELVYRFNRKVMINSLTKSGSLGSSYTELLGYTDYYLTSEGIETLKQNIRDNDLSFDFGSMGDGIHYYYDDIYRMGALKDARVYDPVKRCKSVELQQSDVFGDVYIISPMFVECPETENTISIFNDDLLMNSELSGSYIISKNDIIHSGS